MDLYSVVFSPTGGTEKAVLALAEGLGQVKGRVDLCDPKGGEGVSFGPGDLCLVGVPSYGGRVPATAAERLLRLRGNGAAAVAVAVYGNRAFEDTLVELRDLLARAGFRCAAGVAAVAEHSIARTIAQGRPDGEDCRILASFGRAIGEKLASGASGEPELPGDRPYKEWGGSGLKPSAGESCVRCGRCAAACPVGAIPREDPSATDPEKCISCMRCIAVCPHGARSLPAEKVEATAQRLAKASPAPKAPELFL